MAGHGCAYSSTGLRLSFAQTSAWNWFVGPAPHIRSRGCASGVTRVTVSERMPTVTATCQVPLRNGSPFGFVFEAVALAAQLLVIATQST
jgi:hypothetical protein